MKRNIDAKTSQSNKNGDEACTYIYNSTIFIYK